MISKNRLPAYTDGTVSNLRPDWLESSKGTYTAQFPLLILRHPSCLARRKLNEELLRALWGLGNAIGIEHHPVRLARLDKARADRREEQRKERGVGNLHDWYDERQENRSRLRNAERDLEQQLIDRDQR